MLKSPSHQEPISQPHFWEENGGFDSIVPASSPPLKKKVAPATQLMLQIRDHTLLFTSTQRCCYMFEVLFQKRVGFFPFVFVSAFGELARAGGGGSPHSSEGESVESVESVLLGVREEPPTRMKRSRPGSLRPRSLRSKSEFRPYLKLFL